MKRYYFYLIMLTMLWSCGDQKIDTAQARAEMEAREIKKVSEAEIVEKAMALGKELTSNFSLYENGSITADLGEATEFRKAHYFLEDTTDLEGKALSIFQAYQYNAENNINSEPIVQKIDNGKTFFYTSPSYFNNEMLGIWAIWFSRKELVLQIED